MDNTPETTVNTEHPETIAETEKTAKKTDQEILLDIQMNSAKKARVFDVLTIVSMMIVIFGLAVAMFIIPDQSFSEQENRVLTQFPAISSKTEGSMPLDRFINGSFTLDIAKYYADQFPLRDVFVGLKGTVEIALLKRENNDVILGRDNYLITRDTPPDFEQIQINTDNISVFADIMAQMKIPVTLAAAGRTIDAMASYMPPTYPLTYSENLWRYFDFASGEAKNISRVNLLNPMKQIIEKNDNIQLYYKTDHHWTTLGAYYAYSEIIKSFKEDNFEPQPLSAFTREIASDSFYGTTWSKAGMKWVQPDIMHYFRYDGDEDFVTEIKDTGVSFNGFYDRSYLELKDKYSSFIGGNNARVDIAKSTAPGDAERPKLLIMKDSFAHAVVPFLAYHYDLIILDLRYFVGSVANIVYDENVDRVLFLYNMANFVTNDYFEILHYNLESVLHDYVMAQYPIRNIYINGNPIKDYVILCKDYPANIAAAELLQTAILDRMGLEIEIVALNPEGGENYEDYDKAIVITDEGLPAKGFLKIATEGNSLVLRCNIDDGAGHSVKRFIDKYLKNATGSFNFGSDFVLSDIGDRDIMILPNPNS